MKWKEIIKKSKNNLLLIENSEGRITSTMKKGLYDIVIAKTEYDIDLALQSNNFEVIWIDYDLTRIWKIRNRENSLNVLKKYSRYLEQSGVKLIVIHSWNPIGIYKLYNEFKNLDIEIIVKKHWKMF